MNNLDNLFNIYKLTSLERKIQFLLLFCLMLLSGLCEVVTLASIIPFIKLITQPELAFENKIIKNFALNFNIVDPIKLIIPFCIFFILIVIITSSIQLLNLWLNRKISASVGSEYSRLLFYKIVNQSYEFHIEKNSSDLIAILVKYIDAIVASIRLGLQIVIHFIISVSLIITLIYIDGSIAITSGLIFGFSYFLILQISKRKLKENSNSIANAKINQIKTLQEAIGGIRDVILNNSQEFHLNLYNNIDIPMRKKQAENSFIAASPKYILEAIGLILISLICFSITSKGDPPIEVIPLLGSIALASQRILPSLQNIYSSWAQISSVSSEVSKALYLIKKDLKNKENINTEKLIFKESIKLRNINFKYKNSQEYVLENINLTIKAGEKIGIIGETGSGKSTLIDIITGLLKPSSGIIMIDNFDLYDSQKVDKINAWRKLISYVPQSIYLTDNTFAENIALSSSSMGINKEKLIRSSKQAKIHNFINKSIRGYETFVGEEGIKLSGGQKQRIGIARALYKSSSLLVLDEATSALDMKTEDSVMNSINDLKKNLTVIIVTHRLSTLKQCDRIFKVKLGHLKEVTS